MKGFPPFNYQNGRYERPILNTATLFRLSANLKKLDECISNQSAHYVYLFEEAI